MVYFMNAISVAVVICSIVKNSMGQNNADVKSIDNAEQFALLCRIYNVAKNPPINHVDLRDPNKIVNEIDALNASLTDEKQFNEAEQEGNSSLPHVKPVTTREAAVAQAILRRITGKAHTILDEIKKLNATRDIENVKDEFAQVIFGDGMNESDLCDGVLSGVSGRATACGTTGLSSKSKSAGNKLVVDFFCLCAQRKNDGEGIDNVCGVQVGGSKRNGNHGWGDEAPSGSPSMWASIKKGCGDLLHQHPISTKEGHEVLSDFLKHMKSGGVYKAKASNEYDKAGLKPGMLGTAVTANHGNDLICDGKKGNGRSTPTAGVCVYYGPESEWQSIPWLQKLKNALNTVDALNNKTATIQRDIEKLQTLLHRTEQIYETTKVISEIQNPVQPPNLQTAAKRLTAYNAAWRHHPYAHFILLFVLL